jgi:hypothetical protein
MATSSIQKWSTFCQPLTSLTWSVLNDLRKDLESELESLEKRSLETTVKPFNSQPNNDTTTDEMKSTEDGAQLEGDSDTVGTNSEEEEISSATDKSNVIVEASTAELSLGLVALQLLQSLFLRMTPHEAKKHLATLESEETAKRAAMLLEGAGTLTVSLTSSNIMPLTLRLRDIIGLSHSSSSTSPPSSSTTSPTSSSSTDNMTVINAAATTTTTSTDNMATNSSTALAISELSTTPYAACLTLDDADVETTENDLDYVDRQTMKERREEDRNTLYNVTPNFTMVDVPLLAAATPHGANFSPTSTPSDRSTSLVTRRIRQFENGGICKSTPPAPSPMRGSIDGFIGVDKHPASHYPKPGQWMSPHHRVVSSDKEIALKRDYVGIDIARHGKF